MSPSPFDASLPFVLRWEGGFVDHPDDPGGRTNRGITQAVYDRWRAQQGAEARDVRLVDDAEVRAIYETGYWLPPRCDRLQRHLDLVQFDTAVNMGVGRAVRLLQSALGCEPDGRFGSQTLGAVDACRDVGAAIVAYCDARETYYRRLVDRNPRLQVFLRGWLNRLNALRAEVGLPGYESVSRLDFGEAGYVARIPDIGQDPDFDLEERR